MMDLSDCRCVRCNATTLDELAPVAGAEIARGVIRCTSCGAAFDRVWDVPFLFDYDEDDFAGLIEIVANAHQISPFTPDLLEHWAELLALYHAAEDKKAFEKTVNPASAPWLEHRYNEWRQIEALCQGLDLRGRKVLDVGAGLGFDSYRHVRAGAEVTALEFSPVLAREGARNLPMIRWIGGASHALPFVDGSFDAVFANAALHHMRDIPAALEEMLRVLRPGGVLITTGDAYRKNGSGEEAELQIFNAHGGVLGGINERVPELKDFVDVLGQRRDAVEPRLFTQIVYGAWLVAGRKTVDEFREWNFQLARVLLGQTSGSLALKATLKRPLGAQAKLQKLSSALSPGTLASWLSDPTDAIARLAPWAPPSLVNAPFPRRSQKVDLLNGWRIWQGGETVQGYLRGRWYLSRSGDESSVTFQLSSPRAATFIFVVNGRELSRLNIAANVWTEVEIDVSHQPVATPFVFEVRLSDLPEAFEHGLFEVRDRRMRQRAAA